MLHAMWILGILVDKWAMPAMAPSLEAHSAASLLRFKVAGEVLFHLAIKAAQ
jgi:hypothetical protein